MFWHNRILYIFESDTLVPLWLDRNNYSQAEKKLMIVMIILLYDTNFKQQTEINELYESNSKHQTKINENIVKLSWRVINIQSSGEL